MNARFLISGLDYLDHTPRSAELVLLHCLVVLLVKRRSWKGQTLSQPGVKPAKGSLAEFRESLGFTAEYDFNAQLTIEDIQWLDAQFISVEERSTN